MGEKVPNINMEQTEQGGGEEIPTKFPDFYEHMDKISGEVEDDFDYVGDLSGNTDEKDDFDYLGTVARTKVENLDDYSDGSQEYEMGQELEIEM